MTGGALRWRFAGPSNLEGESKMSAQVKVMAILNARQGKVDALRTLLEGLVTASRAEPGNLRYDLWADPSDEGRFVLDELYIDSVANTSHRVTPHFQHYLSTINDLAERTAVVLAPVDVR